MAKARTSLQTCLESLLGAKHVYFQPPESIKLEYPAIVYSLEGISINKADDSSYKSMKRYNLIYISKAPDESLCDKFLAMPYCSFDRRYVADNLYHDSYTLYF